MGGHLAVGVKLRHDERKVDLVDRDHCGAVQTRHARKRVNPRTSTAQFLARASTYGRTGACTDNPACAHSFCRYISVARVFKMSDELYTHPHVFRKGAF